MRNGIFNGCDFSPEQCDEIDASIHVAHIDDKMGDSVVVIVDEACRTFKPHLVWLDNLNSYAGCELNKQDQVAQFLRAGLSPS